MLDPQSFIQYYLMHRQARLHDGSLVRGESVSYLIAYLRGEGYKNVTEQSLEALGFKIVDGRVGQWTRKGFSFCKPARIVTY